MRTLSLALVHTLSLKSNNRPSIFEPNTLAFFLSPTQHVLEHGEFNDRQAILRQLHGHIVGMSQHKFASNVVEKLLQLSDSDTRNMMLNEITGSHMGSPAVRLFVFVSVRVSIWVIARCRMLVCLCRMLVDVRISERLLMPYVMRHVIMRSCGGTVQQLKKILFFALRSQRFFFPT